MSASRRAVLKWAVAGSGLVALSGGWPTLAAAAAKGLEIVPLVGRSGVDASFLDGIRTGLVGTGAALSQGILLQPGDPSALEDLEQRLSSLRGRRVVGLLDEGRQAIVDEMLRDLGAKVMCTGRHSAGPHTGSSTNHRFATTPCARGIGSVLAGALASASESFAIHETAFGADVPPGGAPVRLDGSRGWAGITGQALARVAADAWIPGPAGHYRHLGLVARTTADHGLVTFAAQL